MWGSRRTAPLPAPSLSPSEHFSSFLLFPSCVRPASVCACQTSSLWPLPRPFCCGVCWRNFQALLSFPSISPKGGRAGGLPCPLVSFHPPSSLGSVSLQGTDREPGNRESLTSTEGSRLQPFPPPPCPPPCPWSLRDLPLSPQGLCTAVPLLGVLSPEICALAQSLLVSAPKCPLGRDLLTTLSETASSVALLAPPPLCLPLSRPSPYTLIHWFIFGLSCIFSATVLPASRGQEESVCPVLCPACRTRPAGRRPHTCSLTK